MAYQTVAQPDGALILYYERVLPGGVATFKYDEAFRATADRIEEVTGVATFLSGRCAACADTHRFEFLAFVNEAAFHQAWALFDPVLAANTAEFALTVYGHPSESVRQALLAGARAPSTVTFLADASRYCGFMLNPQLDINFGTKGLPIDESGEALNQGQAAIDRNTMCFCVVQKLCAPGKGESYFDAISETARFYNGDKGRKGGVMTFAV